MAIINRLIPILEIDLGVRKLAYSAQSFRVRDDTSFRQYAGLLKSEGGISRSMSIQDFKASLGVASNVSVINDDRLQDAFQNFPESFTAVRLAYLYGDDTTAKIEEVVGIASNPSWDKTVFTMNIKDSQKLFFRNVPNVIFDEKTFQQAFVLSDATFQVRTIAVGDPSRPGFLNDGGGNADAGGTKNVTIVKNIVSSAFNGKPLNYWKGSRIDIIYDQRASDDTNQTSGQFAVVVSSWDSTVFLNDKLDKVLVRDDETAVVPLNNTMTSDIQQPGLSYDPAQLTLQVVKDAVPQNAESVGSPVPIIYGAVEKSPVVWAIGQKSTRTNSIGVGDDVYLFASHICKLGVIPDDTLTTGLVTSGNDSNGVAVNNQVFQYNAMIGEEIRDALRTEVYWSLEDKRVVDAKISPGNRNWIPNPFPKRFRGGSSISNAYRDCITRLISPLHRVKLLTTSRGEVVHAIQLRGGEFNWFDLTTKLEQRGQFPVRYGMGNSKLYISVEGWQDDNDGFYTGFTGDFIENQNKTRLIKNPADVMLHFLMNYTSANEDRRMFDVNSFRESRRLLDGWRFDTSITEIISGEQLVDRFSAQCCSVVFVDGGIFKMKTVIPSKMVPKAYLREGEHIVSQRLEFTRTEDIYNSFIFSYKYDYPNKKYSSVLKRDRKNDTQCRASFAMNGFERAKPNVEFRDISDEFTANALADVVVDLCSKRRVYVDAKLVYNQEVIDANLEIGDCVAVTSTQTPNGWTEKLCIVLETRKFTDRMEARLMEV